MVDPAAFSNIALRGGFKIIRVDISTEPLVDAIGREAIARTRITGNNLEITLRSRLSDREFSVTLYHEVLEAATVASASPPTSVMYFNEGDFEAAAYRAHEQFGEASADNLNRMLQHHGFPEIVKIND